MLLLRNRTLLSISLAMGMSFAGVGMVVPVRVLYAQSRGASLFIIGAMASSFLLANFAFQYPSGWLADLWGRKRMMVVGLTAQAAISLVYLVIADPVLFVILRFAEGAVSASVVPSARALVAESVPAERRGEAFGVFSSFFNAGFLLGPALGGLLAVLGYESAFVGSFVFRALAVVLVLLLVPTEGHIQPEDRQRARDVPRRALVTLPLVGAYLLTFGDNIFFGFELTLLPLWMRYHLHAPVTIIGLSYAVWALPNILGSPIGGRVADRRRRSGLVFVFGLAQVPLYAAMGLANAAAPILIIFTIHGAVYSLIQPAVDAHLAAASPPDAWARAQSVYSAVGLASGFIAANTLPFLYALNFRLPLFAMAAAFGLCILAGGILVRLSEHRGLVNSPHLLPTTLKAS